jgi:Bacterial antitoxin of type II TA system, VapB
MDRIDRRSVSYSQEPFSESDRKKEDLQSKSNHTTLVHCLSQRVGAKLVFARLGAAFRWAITRIAPTKCANLLWSDLDEEMIEKARRLFHAKTDTEAIQKALQKAVEDQEMQEALDSLLKEGRFRTIYQ